MKTVEEVKRILGVTSDQELAKRAGRGASAVSNWKKAGEVPVSVLVSLGVVQGVEEKERSYAIAAADMVKIPLYGATAQGGPGAINDQERIESYMSFTREYARVQFGSSGTSLACLKASGDSMSPYISPGDVMIVDVSDRYITKDGAAYILQIEETTVVKRLQRLSKDKVRIASDNPTGWTRDLGLNEMAREGISISGRVVAVIKMA